MTGAGGRQGKVIDGGDPVPQEDLLPATGHRIVICNGRAVLTIVHPDIAAEHASRTRHADSRWRLRDNRDGTFTLY